MDILAHILEFIPYWTSEVQAILQDKAQLWGRDHTNGARLKALQDTTKNDLTETLRQMAAAAKSAAATLGSLRMKRSPLKRLAAIRAGEYSQSVSLSITCSSSIL